MAEKQTEFAYRHIELYKSESLGSGSYGGVCKAKCDGLLCAAKIMHPTLFDMHDPGNTSYLVKFQAECHLLSLARHPNIVQYLATYDDPETRLPVLLMELCDESLTAFLERSPEPLSYHIQVKICHDIALALVYLHSNGLIHRDLTGNNVLMVAGPRAKITDFGMSKLATVNPRMTALTLCPGNVLYMSPEALDDATSYTAKLDIFSFGVIVIQILTRQFPNPTDRFRHFPTASTEHSDEDEKLDVRQVVPDRERRKQHLQLIPDTHSLKPLALQCLKRRESVRPSALELSQRISELKQSPAYTDSLQQAQNPNNESIQTVEAETDKQQQTVVEELLEMVCAKDKELEECRSLIHNMESQIQECRQTIEAKNRELWEKETELVSLTGALRRKEREAQALVEAASNVTRSTMNEAEGQNTRELQQTPEKEQEHEEMASQLHESTLPNEEVMQGLNLSEEEHREKQPLKAGENQHLEAEDEPVIVHLPPTHPVRLLEEAGGRRNFSGKAWATGKMAPEQVRRGAAVVHEDKAYFRPANSVKVYCYQNIVGIQHWSELPENPNTNCGLVVIENLLTTVGGIGYNNPTNTLLSLVDGKKEKKWQETLPHMAVPRYAAACITTEKVLVVAGGRAADEGLSSVEVMRIDSKQWSVVSSLPRKCWFMSPTVVGDTLFLAGGFVQDKPSKCTLYCSVSNLLSSSAMRSKILWSLSNSLGAWKEVSEVPVTRSTLISFGGNLLALGGEDHSEKPTTAVHGYDSSSDSWNRVSQMNERRSWCLAITLPENRLVVVGGFTDKDSNITSSVEILN